MNDIAIRQTVIEAAYEVDDAFHGVEDLMVPEPIKRACKRLCLALEYMQDEGKPSHKFLYIMDLISEGEDKARAVREASRGLDYVVPVVKAPLNPAQKARKAMKERAKQYRAAKNVNFQREET